MGPMRVSKRRKTGLLRRERFRKVTHCKEGLHGLNSKETVEKKRTMKIKMIPYRAITGAIAFYLMTVILQEYCKHLR